MMKSTGFMFNGANELMPCVDFYRYFLFRACVEVR